MSVDLFPYTPERDVYRLLQIQPEADTSEVIAACRRLAATFHPDLNGSPRATEEMQVVNAIRRLLTDPRQRAAYDGARRRWIAEHHERQRNGYQLSNPTERQAVGPGWVVDSLAARLRRAWAAGSAPSLPEPGQCPACAAPIEPEYRFCGSCGNRLLAQTREGGQLRR
jgi:curved DNA-binding protein CbpA